jgi:uncharacterized membrane protein YagU involved in acid resistance
VFKKSHATSLGKDNRCSKGVFFCVLWGEIMVKKAKGAKVKVIFQGLHMTHVIFALVYNFVFCILKAPFNTTF